MPLGENGKLTPEDYRQMQEQTEIYRNNAASVNVEKIALNNQWQRKLQEAFQLEMECVKKDIEIQKLRNELQILKTEIAGLKAKKVETEITDIIDQSPSDSC